MNAESANPKPARTPRAYWSPVVHRLTPYVPGEQPKLSHLVKLNTNENPYGPSPKVLDAIRAELSDTLRLYPDRNAERFRRSAERLLLEPFPSGRFIGAVEEDSSGESLLRQNESIQQQFHHHHHCLVLRKI